MTEMDNHTELEAPVDELVQAELADPEVPVADAAEQATPLTEPDPDHETLPLDEDEYR